MSDSNKQNPAFHGENIKVHALTNWQNEEWMSALWFLAYAWVDRITIKLEPSTDDGTRDEIARFQNDPSYTPTIEVIEHSECNGLIDDRIKADKDNEIIHASDADWVIRVDSDQFVFPKPFGRDPRKALEEVPEERLVVIAAQWQVYRHATDLDVDRTKHPVPQRLHGNPDRTDAYSTAFISPVIMRPRAKPRTSVGCHFISGFNGDNHQLHGGYGILNGVPEDDPRIHRELWSGSHYRAAEPKVCIPRRVDQRILRLGAWNSGLDDKFRGPLPRPSRDQLLAAQWEEAQLHMYDPIVIEM